MNVQKFPHDNKECRIETGPIQFGDDWPGIFIRGDNAHYYKYLIEQAIDLLPTHEVMLYKELKELVELFDSCRITGE